MALFSSEQGAADRLIPRWIVLRALGLIYCSAFVSLLFQIRGSDRACRHPARGPIPGRRSRNRLGPWMRLWFAPTLLWLASGSHMLMAMCWAGPGRFAAADRQHLAASHAPGLLCLLSFLRQRGPGFFRLPIRRHAARSRISGAVLCPARLAAGAGLRPSAFTRQPVPAAVGVVPHLLRIGPGEAAERRHRMAPSDRDGRVLPEWSPAHLDRMVHPAPAALVPLGDGVLHAGAGTGHRLDALSSPPLAHPLLSHRHPVGNWRDLHRQLHLSQLPGSGAGIPVAGRPLLQPLGKN